MNRFSLRLTLALWPTLVAALLAVFTCPAVDAAIFERDWQTPGDGLLTFDNVNDRVWLDLSETLLEQFPGATLEEQYQSVVDQTLPGGQFDGFTVANSNDVIALAESARVDIETDDFVTNSFATENLINLLGVTITGPFGRITSYGFLDELREPPRQQPRLAMLLVNDPSEGSVLLPRAFIGFGGDDRINESTIGVMVYRQIPEPSTLILALGAAMFVAVKCRR